jgi:hypothetical protein
MTRRISYLLFVIVVLGTTVLSQNQRDLVKGNLIQFNDNGAWCWFQDERAVVDVSGGKLVLGSDAGGTGVGGSPRNGDIDAVVFDLQHQTSQRATLREGSADGGFGCDDHNAPAFLVRPDGKYVAFCAGHNGNYSSYYRIYDAGNWGPLQEFDWNARRPGGVNYQTTYSNLFYLSAENRTYNFARGHNKSPNSMISSDMGNTWSYGGQLTTNQNIGYVNGYLRYWGNGVDRIDFICTEYHPRDYFTSIYHGYIQNMRSYNSYGVLIDDNVLDTLNVPTPTNFTRIFADSTLVAGYLMRRCWNTDLMRYNDGTIVAIITARTSQFTGSDGSINPEHAFIYCRFDGSSWSYHYLTKAGPKLFSSEADYAGLAAIHPNDPGTIYISTTYDPRDTTVNLGVHEIFKAVTNNNGVSWIWTPITSKSVRQNLRPIIPRWNSNNTALLWWRGTYNSAQSFDAATVGILDRRLDTVTVMRYVDATPANTTLSTGAPLVTTGPDSNQGPADNQWHRRTGYGNGGSVFTSAEIGGENAPALKTQTVVPGVGTYDLWVNFWANPTTPNDWRIRAGLSSSAMQLFRQMACKEVEAGDHDSTLVLTGGGNTFLYQAYVGRVRVSANDTFRVFVDDDAIQTGTTGTLVGNTCRTWYDGISYARVGASAVSVAEGNDVPTEFSLSQNYPNPFNPATTINFSIPLPGTVDLRVYDLLGREIGTLVNTRMSAGTHIVTWRADDVSSGVYFYRITFDNYSRTNKMIVLK